MLNFRHFFYFSLVKGRDVDGFPETQEMFIRDCVKKYPYPESCILQHMAKQLAPIKIVSTGSELSGAGITF
jgi:hypothetical protein